MSLMYHDTVIAGTPVIDNTPTAGSNHAVSSGGVKSALDTKAGQTDLASIHATGSTNTTGAEIEKGTYFYLNDVLVLAKADIATGASYTSGTNYETVTAGALNELGKFYWISSNYSFGNVGSRAFSGHNDLDIPSNHVVVGCSSTSEESGTSIVVPFKYSQGWAYRIYNITSYTINASGTAYFIVAKP